MRVGVVDIGSNSTRLLVADVTRDGAVTELERRSTVTRLGHGVDGTGRLHDDAMERVFATLAEYRAGMDDCGVDGTIAVMTSAVRDAANGAAFADAVRGRFALEVTVLSGDEEARLTFLGTTDDRGDDDELVVIDIGGGSTELVVGERETVAFHVSTQAGVVRQTERHLHDDPPTAPQVEALRAEVAEIFADAVPAAVRDAVVAGVAVAGAATSCAAMVQELEPYDPARVHGFLLSRTNCEDLLRRLAAMTNEQRRRVPGLHPDRAGTIVAGVALLLEALDAFGLEIVEISEHDILRGAALVRAGARQASDPGDARH